MDCNEHLILKLTSLAKNIEKIVDTAGEKLVDNIRDEAKKSFGNSKYPYEFQNDFQKPETVQYKKGEKVVEVKHPAALTLEYGLSKDIVIKPKDATVLKFTGEDGKEIYRPEVTILKSSRRPVGYARKAIRKTQKDIAKIFKGEVVE